MIFKKILSSLLAIIFVFTVISSTLTIIIAAADTIIKIEDLTTKKGEVITVKSQNGIEDACNITVLPEPDPILPFKEISLTGGDKNVIEEIELNIPEPFPVTWSAYSNDSFIYVTTNKKYEVKYSMTIENQSLNKLTILCDPTLIPMGTYTGTVTVICGDISENILITYTKTTNASDNDFLFYYNDPFYENPYRTNLALNGIATASSTYFGQNEQGNPVYTIDGMTSWPRWISLPGTWMPLTHHWLTVDLKEIKKFDKVTMYFVHAEQWAIDKEFKIFASNNNSDNDDDWTEIAYIENNKQRVVTIDFDEMAYRYVRYYSIMPVQSDGYENCARITQFKILSKIEYPEVKMSKSLKGDVNNDESVTIADAIAIFRRLADKEFTTNIEAAWAADVNGKDGITIQDAICIFRYLADKITMEQLQSIQSIHLEV